MAVKGYVDLTWIKGGLEVDLTWAIGMILKARCLKFFGLRYGGIGYTKLRKINLK